MPVHKPPRKLWYTVCSDGSIPNVSNFRASSTIGIEFGRLGSRLVGASICFRGPLGARPLRSLVFFRTTTRSKRMADLVAAFTLGVLFKEVAGSWEHLRGPLLAALPIVGHLCNVGCRRIKNAVASGQLKNSSEHACVPTLKITRPKKRTFSDVSDLIKDLNQVPQNSPIVPTPILQEPLELPSLPGKRAVSTDESGPVPKPTAESVPDELLDAIKTSALKKSEHINSAIQQELFHKDLGIPEVCSSPIDVPEVAPATQLDLLVTSRRDQHENSLAEETLIPCTKPSNKFVSDLELETTQ